MAIPAKNDPHYVLLCKDLKLDKGWQPKPYWNAQGSMMIGTKRTLNGTGSISTDEANYLLMNDIIKVQLQLDRHCPWWRKLDAIRMRILENMGFNLGISGLLKFKKMLAALQEGKYDEAAKEMENSKWARDVKGRAVRLMKEMRTGDISPGKITLQGDKHALPLPPSELLQTKLEFDSSTQKMNVPDKHAPYYDFLCKALTIDEGLRLQPYKDTVGKWTIGIGRNLDDVGISEEENDYLLINDIYKVEADLDAHWKWWRNLDGSRMRALVNMGFSMGVPTMHATFNDMLAFAQADTYKKASSVV